MPTRPTASSPSDFEIEAVTTDAAPAAPDLDAPSESSRRRRCLVGDHARRRNEPASRPRRTRAYALEAEDDAAPIELTSESIDLQRFVDELSNDAIDVDGRKSSPRSKDDVLAEFEEALEVITDEPNRPDSHSEADSDVLTPLAGSPAWPHLDSTVAEPAAAAGPPADAAPRQRGHARARSPERWRRKKSGASSIRSSAGSRPSWPSSIRWRTDRL